MSYDQDNIFAKIIRGEIPGDRVYEDDQVLAIRDIAPAAPVHILVMPKGDFVSFDDFSTHASANQVMHFFKVIPLIAKKVGIDDSGYRLITNHGEDASQSVPHFHVHLIGGIALGALLAGDTVER